MQDLNDETLMAFVDGELSADASAALAKRMTTDEGFKRRVNELQQLNERVRRAYASDLSEPVPATLLAVACGDLGHDAVSAQIHQFPKHRRMASDWRWWGGMAASLAVGLVLLQGPLQRWQDGPPLLVQSGTQLLAAGPLAKALERGLSSEGWQGPDRLHVTFLARDGRYCRTFSSGTAAGLACRQDDGWHVEVVDAPATPAASSGMRLAGGELSPLLIDAVAQRIKGSAFDAEQERQARDRSWQR
jgi:hypothetical protein